MRVDIMAVPGGQSGYRFDDNICYLVLGIPTAMDSSSARNKTASVPLKKIRYEHNQVPP